MRIIKNIVFIIINCIVGYFWVTGEFLGILFIKFKNDWNYFYDFLPIVLLSAILCFVGNESKKKKLENYIIVVITSILMLVAIVIWSYASAMADFN